MNEYSPQPKYSFLSDMPRDEALNPSYWQQRQAFPTNKLLGRFFQEDYQDTTPPHVAALQKKYMELLNKKNTQYFGDNVNALPQKAQPEEVKNKWFTPQQANDNPHAQSVLDLTGNQPSAPLRQQQPQMSLKDFRSQQLAADAPNAPHNNFNTAPANLTSRPASNVATLNSINTPAAPGGTLKKGLTALGSVAGSYYPLIAAAMMAYQFGKMGYDGYKQNKEENKFQDRVDKLGY
jgi:hypothetical protein